MNAEMTLEDRMSAAQFPESWPESSLNARSVLEATFFENNLADAERAALAWIEAEPNVATWRLVGIAHPQPTTARYIAEFEVTFR